MKIIPILGALVASLLITSSVLYGQSERVPTEALTAALVHMRSHLPEGRIALLDEGPIDGISATLARTLRAELTTRKAAKVCDDAGNPASRCFFRGAVGALAEDRAVQKNGSTTVYVEVLQQYTRDDDTWIASKVYKMELQKGRAGWRVIASKLMFET